MPAEKLVRQTFPVGALGCNCTIVSCPETREALVIDPGDDDRWLYDHAVMQTEAFGIRSSDGKRWQPPPAPTHELRGDEAIVPRSESRSRNAC